MTARESNCMEKTAKERGDFQTTCTFVQVPDYPNKHWIDVKFPLDSGLLIEDPKSIDWNEKRRFQSCLCIPA